MGDKNHVFRLSMLFQLATDYVSSVLYKTFLADIPVINSGFQITLHQRIKVCSGVTFYNWVSGY